MPPTSIVQTYPQVVHLKLTADAPSWDILYAILLLQDWPCVTTSLPRLHFAKTSGHCCGLSDILASLRILYLNDSRDASNKVLIGFARIYRST